jgi:hypothetical protein
VFFSYLQYYYNLEERRYELISYLEDFFSPLKGDLYYIVDPYLDVVKSIQNPYKDKLVEDDNWSFLISVLANPDVEFYIITRESIDGIIEVDKTPPYSLPISHALNGANVKVCKYIDTKYLGLSIHDRYILRENNNCIKGIHLGCSLADIYDKDISVTAFSSEGAGLALKYFKQIWDECINKKGWKKG